MVFCFYFSDINVKNAVKYHPPQKYIRRTDMIDFYYEPDLEKSDHIHIFIV
jgi:hypothetical protein